MLNFHFFSPIIGIAIFEHYNNASSGSRIMLTQYFYFFFIFFILQKWMTQLWMNANWVDIEFHLGNLSSKE
jgi:hypothetical protein